MSEKHDTSHLSNAFSMISNLIIVTVMAEHGYIDEKLQRLKQEYKALLVWEMIGTTR